MINHNRDEDEDDGFDEEDEDEEDEDEDEDNEDDDDEEGDEYSEEVDDVPLIESVRVKAYKNTLRQLVTFYREISIISNKKPDSPLNTFKLGLINETLV